MLIEIPHYAKRAFHHRILVTAFCLPPPMNFDLSDEQKLLRDEARRLLRESAGFDRCRRHLDSGAPYDQALWSQVAGLGWLGVAVPESQGGLGLGPLDLCVLVEELGRCLAPVPFFSTAGLGALLLKRCPGGQALLAEIAAGRCVTSVAFGAVPENPRPSPDALAWDGQRVTGRISSLADAMGADRLLVWAVDSEGAGFWLVVDAHAAGCTRTVRAGMDGLRSYGCVGLQQVAAEVLLQGHAAITAREGLLSEAAILTAFEQVGGAEAALGMACEYVQGRYAFGRPVGGNQAVKHKLADAMVAIELARSNAWYAAWVMENSGTELSRAAAAARLSAIEAYVLAAEENLHLHGGIGYTWEADCHFHVRRARLLATSVGHSAFWSQRLLGDAPAQDLA